MTLVSGLQSLEARQGLSEALRETFECWALHEKTQAELLGLANVMALQRGEPLPADRNVLERAGHVLAIERSLKKLFPGQPERRAHWLSTPNPRLGGLAPLTIMLGGVKGMKSVQSLTETQEEL